MRQKENKVRRKITRLVWVDLVQRTYSMKFYTGVRTKLYLLLWVFQQPKQNWRKLKASRFLTFVRLGFSLNSSCVEKGAWCFPSARKVKFELH